MIEAAKEKKAVEITVLELNEVTSFTDHFVICNGESEPQIRSIFRNIQDKLQQIGRKVHHMEGSSETGWILMDYIDFVVHIFSPEKRTYYELDRLWADAPRWDVAEEKARKRAIT